MPRSVLIGVVLLIAGPALAATSVVNLQNDSFVSGSPGSLTPQLITGEGWGVTFKVEPDALPVKLTKLQGLFVDDPFYAGAECGLVYVRVYEDTGVNYPLPDGPAIFDSEAEDYYPDLPAVLALQEFDLSGFDVWIEAPGFRVQLQTAGQGCALHSGQHYPVLAVDADGVSSVGVNYVASGTDAAPEWTDMSGAGVSGDFILRASVETTGCTPDCTGKECGSNGCGGSCGFCNGFSECVSGQCCTPDCTDKACGGDGCGGSCGQCPANAVCNNNQCSCLPDCAGRECGDDGCGGSCGSCDAGCTCSVGGQCEGSCGCMPACTGKECGPDGCGGLCGQCAAGDDCQPDGTCAPVADTYEPDVQQPDSQEPDAPQVDLYVPDAAADTWAPEVGDALRVDSIVPNHGASTEPVDVIVLGAGFQAGVTVRLDADHITVNHVEATTIEATVPMGLASGAKTLIVQNPDGAPLTVTSAYTVDPVDVVSTGSGSSCAVGRRGVPAIQVLAALALVIVALRRRVSREG